MNKTIPEGVICLMLVIREFSFSDIRAITELMSDLGHPATLFHYGKQGRFYHEFEELKNTYC